MKTVRTLAVTLALFACGTAAFAADSTSDYIRQDAPKGITEAFYACIDKAGSDTVGMAACQTTEKQKQDARLNKAYKALLAKLDSKAKEDLKVAQREWLVLKDKDGRLESALYGKETVDNLQMGQNDMFRLCERANTLEKYLAVMDLK
jgi:uncharacterized protein YecT (DUF1311 family)